jgi:hypothetical protein
MCCGNGCTPHRPLVNPDRDTNLSGHSPAAPVVDVPQAPKPVGQETRRNGRWRYGTTRKLTDVQESYDGGRTELPRPVRVQADQMTGVIPTPQTSIRRTATRDTGAGGCT